MVALCIYGRLTGRRLLFLQLRTDHIHILKFSYILLDTEQLQGQKAAEKRE